MIVQVSLLFVSLRIGPIELVQSRHLLFEVPVPSQESAQSYMEEQVQGGCPPPKIGKNRIFWRKIVIFHTKYPTNFRASLHSAQFF